MSTEYNIQRTTVYGMYQSKCNESIYKPVNDNHQLALK